MLITPFVDVMLFYCAACSAVRTGLFDAGDAFLHLFSRKVQLPHSESYNHIRAKLYRKKKRCFKMEIFP